MLVAVLLAPLVLSGCGAVLSASASPRVRPPTRTATAPSTVAQSAPPGHGTSAAMLRVVDGDTVRVRLLGSARTLTVRVLGIQAPDVAGPHTDAECWGPRAAAWARKYLVPGTRIRLRGDPGQPEYDRSGRRLAYVTLSNGVDYSTFAASYGMARPHAYHNKPVSEAGKIAAAAQHARQADLGLWGPPCNGHVGPGSHPQA
jgi:micrococcal nuclease